MSAYNPHLQRSLRFCELCGQFMGNLTRRDWDRGFHLCHDCLESRDNFIIMGEDKSRKEWEALWRKG